MIHGLTDEEEYMLVQRSGGDARKLRALIEGYKLGRLHERGALLRAAQDAVHNLPSIMGDDGKPMIFDAPTMEIASND